MLAVANIRAPLKEQLYENYLFSEQGEDVYYMEVTMKHQKHYV